MRAGETPYHTTNDCRNLFSSHWPRKASDRHVGCHSKERVSPSRVMPSGLCAGPVARSDTGMPAPPQSDALFVLDQAQTHVASHRLGPPAGLVIRGRTQVEVVSGHEHHGPSPPGQDQRERVHVRPDSEPSRHRLHPSGSPGLSSSGTRSSHSSTSPTPRIARSGSVSHRISSRRPGPTQDNLPGRVSRCPRTCTALRPPARGCPPRAGCSPLWRPAAPSYQPRWESRRCPRAPPSGFAARACACAATSSCRASPCRRVGPSPCPYPRRAARVSPSRGAAGFCGIGDRFLGLAEVAARVDLAVLLRRFALAFATAAGWPARAATPPGGLVCSASRVTNTSSATNFFSAVVTTVAAPGYPSSFDRLIRLLTRDVV